nr:TIR domain-containing protein [Odoribacter splanchnicus]
MDNKRIYDNYAFISYKREDEKWAEWLQRKLEGYKLPTILKKTNPSLPRHLRPIFRDKTDLGGGILSDELEKQLQSSEFLIVICSPHASRSEWVNKEIQVFIDEGRLGNIIPFIVEGLPHAGSAVEECFPQALKNIPKDKELLGIDVQEIGKERAFIKVIAWMLSLRFDSLWQRWQREKRLRRSYVATMLAFLLIIFYFFAIPSRVELTVKDLSHRLPLPSYAKIIFNGTEQYIGSLDTVLILDNIRPYYKGRPYMLEFNAGYYDTLRFQGHFSWGMTTYVTLELKRDSTFGVYQGIVYDEQEGVPVQDAVVTVDNRTTRTDVRGIFKIVFPLQEQTLSKSVRIEKEGYLPRLRVDECPDAKNLTPYPMRKNTYDRRVGLS